MAACKGLIAYARVAEAGGASGAARSPEGTRMSQDRGECPACGAVHGGDNLVCQPEDLSDEMNRRIEIVVEAERQRFAAMVRRLAAASAALDAEAIRILMELGEYIAEED